MKIQPFDMFNGQNGIISCRLSIVRPIILDKPGDGAIGLLEGSRGIGKVTMESLDKAYLQSNDSQNNPVTFKDRLENKGEAMVYLSPPTATARPLPLTQFYSPSHNYIQSLQSDHSVW